MSPWLHVLHLYFEYGFLLRVICGFSQVSVMHLTALCFLLFCSLAGVACADIEVFVHSDSLKLHSQQVKDVFFSEAPPGGK